VWGGGNRKKGTKVFDKILHSANIVGEKGHLKARGYQRELKIAKKGGP